MRRSLRPLVLLTLCLPLVACQPQQKPQELDFETHWSVMRGNWKGTLENFSAGTKLELKNLEASCDTPKNNDCYVDTFSGGVFLDGIKTSQISGGGRAGGGNIYTLTSPVLGMGFKADFSLNGKNWRMDANVLAIEGQEQEKYLVRLSEQDVLDANVYLFELEPTN